MPVLVPHSQEVKLIIKPSEQTISALYRQIQEEADASTRSNQRVYLARAFKSLGQFDQATEQLEMALADNPHSSAALKSLGLEIFRSGSVVKGLEMYDKGRWCSDEYCEKFGRPYKHPYWHGEPVHGKKILVWGEQGIGDQLMQARVIEGLVEQGAIVTLESDPRLFPLLGRLQRGIECFPQTVEANSKLKEENFDFQTSMLSAWRFTTPHLNNAHYLHADTVACEKYKAIFEKMSATKNVGLSWFTKSKEFGRQRSIDLSYLHPLTRHKTVNFHSLQYGPLDLAREVKALGAPIYSDETIDPFESLENQAAQISALDLVITIDNTTAHLAAGLGVKTWLMLPKGSEWRWGVKREETDLYSYLRLFRSDDHDSWSSLLPRLFKAFDDFVTH